MLKLDKRDFDEARKLAESRMKAFKKYEDKKEYLKKMPFEVRFNRHFKGSVGEIAFAQMLEYEKIKFAPLYKWHMSGPDMGDFGIGNIYVELKTRSPKDWKIYGNRLQEHQYQRYKWNGKQAKFVVVWMCYDEQHKKAFISGWNKMWDFNEKIKEPKMNWVTCAFIRHPRDLFTYLTKKPSRY